MLRKTRVEYTIKNIWSGPVVSGTKEIHTIMEPLAPPSTPQTFSSSQTEPLCLLITLPPPGLNTATSTHKALSARAFWVSGPPPTRWPREQA